MEEFPGEKAEDIEMEQMSADVGSQAGSPRMDRQDSGDNFEDCADHHEEEAPGGAPGGAEEEKDGEAASGEDEVARAATYGKWVGRELTGDGDLCLWIPEGFAHGFLALEDETLVHYKCTDMHTPEAERALYYADPDVSIGWPIEPSIVTQKDADAPRLADVEAKF